MKKFLLVGALLVSTSPAMADWRQDVLSEVSEGTTVKDAAWTSTGSLWLGVIDDGTRRDGFAQYACEVIRQHHDGSRSFIIVRVWDIVKMTANQEMVELGRNECEP